MLPPVRVMVVEDHDMTRAALCEVLGAEPEIDLVACCAAGQEAIDRLEEARPDVVVTDLFMPSVDGIDITAEVRRRNPAARVLVLTVEPHSHRAAEALAAGAHVILPKTTEPGAVVSAVRAVSRDRIG